MIIEVNSDQSIDGGNDLNEYTRSVIEKAFNRFGDEITRVEVHLSDENGPKGSDNHGDKRCMIETRMRGVQPLAVTAHADNLHVAIANATDKSMRAMENTIGKRRER